MTVQQYLSTLPKDEVIHYRANPGNAGDALIASGAYKAFRTAGVTFRLLDPARFDASGKTVVYAGGGNLVGLYPEAREFFLEHHRQAKQLILLPHTVAKNEDLLSSLGGNVILFAREMVSYEHLRKHARQARVAIDHDLALQLDAGEILAQPIGSPATDVLFKLAYRCTGSARAESIPQIKMIVSTRIFEARSRLLGNSKVANCFRTDVERSKRPVPRGNADVSTIYAYGTYNEAVTNYTTVRLLKYLNRFDRIRTDRLHVCIAAALLGKVVELYSNSYYKCLAVYEYSLKDRFPNVKWMGARE